jgi:mono/diheme cytochrome c family protein
MGGSVRILAFALLVALLVVPAVEGMPQAASQSGRAAAASAKNAAGQLSARDLASIDALRLSLSGVAERPTSTPAADDSLEAKGKMLYASYGCSDCHGMNGEGTDAAPDLTATHLSPEEIAAFLEKPSPDARGAGMPTIPADSPDLKPLVAYVVSLKKAK